MILGINAIGTRHSGAATVLLDLLHGLLIQSEPAKIIVFASPERERQFEFPRSDRLKVVDSPSITREPIRRFIWLQTRFDSWVRSCGCDVVLNFNNLAGKITVPQILFVQQSLYFSKEAISAYRSLPVTDMKRWRVPAEARMMRMFMSMSAKHSEQVVVQTQTMREWIIQWLGVPNHRVTVIPPGIPRLELYSKKNAIKLESLRDDRFQHFLYVGNSAPYKNLKVIFSASQLAYEKGKNWKFYVTTDIPQTVINPNLMSLGTLDRGELFETYRLIDALIMPSLVETVGLPMLEAMAMGKPVIAADRPYAHEVCGEAALYFDPRQVSDLYENLEKVDSNPLILDYFDDARRKQLVLYPKPNEIGLIWLLTMHSATLI